MRIQPDLPTTQDFVDVEEIKNDIVIMKDGAAAMVIEIAAINFGLFSEREQEATIYAYAQLLNSLTFSIQIVIASHRKDITDYLRYIDAQLEKSPKEEIRGQIVKYREFVKSVVRQNNVLDKKFYVVIPFSALELGVSNSLTTLTRKKANRTLDIDTIVDRATTNLAPKRDHLIRLFARIGLRSRQLTSQELLQLYYEFHNRESVGIKPQFPKDIIKDTVVNESN